MALAAAASLCLVGTASATTFDTSPRPVVMLRRSDQFLAQDGVDGVALYNFSDRSLVRRFRARSRVDNFGVGLDEDILVLVSRNGHISARDLGAGDCLWDLSPEQTGSNSIYVPWHFQVGRSFVIESGQYRHWIFDTRTGNRVGAVPRPPGQTRIETAALEPEGTKGVFVGTDGELYSFDVTSGSVAKTGLAGLSNVSHAVCSSNGRHIALLSDIPSGDTDFLIVKTGGERTLRLVARRFQIGLLRATTDGCFLLTSVDLKGNAPANWDEDIVGEVWRPGAARLTEL